VSVPLLASQGEMMPSPAAHALQGRQAERAFVVMVMAMVVMVVVVVKVVVVVVVAAVMTMEGRKKNQQKDGRNGTFVRHFVVAA
jgi:heme/copper-type cytochrome/quinol oxidase subunit 2